MNIKEILQFFKVTLENNFIAAVKAIKAHIFTVSLKSNKVEVTNPFKLPKTVRTQEVSPINNKRDIERQTKEFIKNLEKGIEKLNKSLKELIPKSVVEVKNLKDIPSPLKSIKVLNPQKTVAITNFYELQKEIGKVKKAVEALKLDPKIIVPEIKVPDVFVPEIKQPEIKNNIVLDKLEKLIGKDPKKYIPVRLTDGKKFYEALEELNQTISGGGGGKYAFQSTSGERTYGLVNLLRQLMVVNEERWGLNNSLKSGNTTYTGEEDVDGNWIVRKIVKTGNNVAMSYATKKNNSTIITYTEAWDGKTELEYGNFSVAFKLT